MKTLIISAIAIVSLGLTACSSNKGPLNEGFGDAVNQNTAVHIIPPKYAAVKDIDMNGNRAGLAMDRYKTGNVIPPSTESTSSIGEE
ncbi:MAG: hypothetical protein V7723_10800 [Sneathiella sp.]|uniref:hypothetical protein n=1 Tax=Sneathiella sp. TaxID=1964365 RepID=UPI0030024B44